MSADDKTPATLTNTVSGSSQEDAVDSAGTIDFAKLAALIARAAAALADAQRQIAELTRERDAWRFDSMNMTDEACRDGEALANAKRNLDAAIATATIANVGLKAAVARADKAEAERDALREHVAELERKINESTPWRDG